VGLSLSWKSLIMSGAGGTAAEVPAEIPADIGALKPAPTSTTSLLSGWLRSPRPSRTSETPPAPAPSLSASAVALGFRPLAHLLPEIPSLTASQGHPLLAEAKAAEPSGPTSGPGCGNGSPPSVTALPV